MNDNITYVQQFDHRQPSYSQNNIIQYETQPIEFHPTSVAQYTNSSGQYHTANTTFITSTGQVSQTTIWLLLQLITHLFCFVNLPFVGASNPPKQSNPSSPDP